MGTPSSPHGLAAAMLRGCAGDVYRAVDGVAGILPALAPPQVVVVGQEGSGKSSVLESVVMFPVFPRESDLRLRLPLRLKLRHHRSGQVEVEGDAQLMAHRGTPPPHGRERIDVRLVHADGRAPMVLGSHVSRQQAAQLVRRWTQQLDPTQLRGVVEHELQVCVQSPHVPDLDVVELPGVVAGRRVDEPDDMMQRSRALAAKFQLVQQFHLTDRTVGVLAMADRAVDDSDPDGPLAQLKRRRDGTSSDLVFLTQGYVAVMNRDSRAKTELTLEEAKVEETEWMQENLPGYIARGLASSAVLAAKLEHMLAEHVRKFWAPQTNARIEKERERAVKELAGLGPDAQQIVNDFLGVSPTTARKRMLELVEPILPDLLSRVDEEILRLVTLVHADFLKSREEHELILAPFQAKNQQSSFSPSSGPLVAASMLMLDSSSTYIKTHLAQIMKNVVLHLVRLIQKTMTSTAASIQKEKSPQRLNRFDNLYYFLLTFYGNN
ncbi:unnamed protein product [Phytophthora fragariaefolia]|uniref:Unnamed protein product n=1 Tax=Phytophthora fragariaefolia TaxID=1490495 RepID=A0A9W6XLN5_9STRA|nr:unnamed protein product [Phytophthora fragariaefolia]